MVNAVFTYVTYVTNEYVHIFGNICLLGCRTPPYVKDDAKTFGWE